MRRRDKHDRQEDSVDPGLWAPVALVLSVALLGVSASVMVLRHEATRPVVGDMVVFRPGTDDRGPWRVNATAWRVDASGQATQACTLSSSVMATGGGSLVVEARLPGEAIRYRVHWAGSRTDSGDRDCGAVADLLMNRIDVRKLATAAGGFGMKTSGFHAAGFIPMGAAMP
jgi:hypothetical protein